MASGEQRAVAIPWRDGEGALEGVFTAGGDAPGGGVIAPPHPLYGGSMDSPVVNEVAFACHQAGLASLAFNWRGVGASPGAPSSDAADADEDYAAALSHLEQSVDLPILACGYSFGAATAVRVARGRVSVRKMVLVAPPPALLDESAFVEFAGPILVIAGENDSIAPPAPLEKLVAAAERATLEVIPQTDHFFFSGLGEISRATGRWLAA